MDFPHAYLLAIAALAVYMVGISLMTTQVSYPLYTSVPAGHFVAYHARYNRQIRPVIIAPGFPSFVACVVFAVVRPDAVPGWLGLGVALGGLIALGATVAAAVPSHLRLQRDGFQRPAYHRLRTADAIRTAACMLSAIGLVISVVTAFTPR